MEVARRLEETPLLGGGRGPVARHQSLVAAIDWSYRLLPEPEQRLFRSMSVFAGGADLRAVHRVADPDGDRGRRAGPADPARRPLHGGGRQRGPQPLPAAGDAAGLRPHRGRRPTGVDAELARRHAAYYVELAERAARGRAGPGRAGLGGARRWPTTTTCAPRSSRPARTATPTWPCGWSRPCPNWSTSGSATRPPAGPSGCWPTRIPTTRDTSRPWGPPLAGRGTAASSPWPGEPGAPGRRSAAAGRHRAHRLPG